jgi:hypothetical protein
MNNCNVSTHTVQNPNALRRYRTRVLCKGLRIRIRIDFKSRIRFRILIRGENRILICTEVKKFRRFSGSEWSPGGSVNQCSQIRITLMRSRIRIRTKMKSSIRIRSKVKSWIRIRIKVMRIRPGRNSIYMFTR